jgi:hypothetical protein
MAKLHTERRDGSGKALCGVDLPHDHDAWARLETCERCVAVARARERKRITRAAEGPPGDPEPPLPRAVKA